VVLSKVVEAVESSHTAVVDADTVVVAVDDSDTGVRATKVSPRDHSSLSPHSSHSGLHTSPRDLDPKPVCLLPRCCSERYPSKAVVSVRPSSSCWPPRKVPTDV
jgi:hypothetical protein